jgi:hypothetical protein
MRIERTLRLRHSAGRKVFQVTPLDGESPTVIVGISSACYILDVEQALCDGNQRWTRDTDGMPCGVGLARIDLMSRHL